MVSKSPGMGVPDVVCELFSTTPEGCVHVVPTVSADSIWQRTDFPLSIFRVPLTERTPYNGQTVEKGGMRGREDVSHDFAVIPPSQSNGWICAHLQGRATWIPIVLSQGALPNGPEGEMHLDVL
jgi:hypothetical protein